jgi:K+-sensing histidine kinase KdpD/DNA-binding winged helix-turn-helix (wHTH) protein
MDTHLPGIGDGQSLTSKWAGFFLALLGIVAATIAGLLIATRWGTAPAVLLYLLPVLGAAIYGGVWLSLAAALIATLAYNYFFTAPFQTLMISRPSDIVTVFVLFIVALVTSSLAGSLREQKQIAAAHAGRNATIAGFARRLLSCADEEAIFGVTVRELARLFRCDAVLVSDEQDPRAVAGAPRKLSLSPADLAAAAHAIAADEPAGRGVRRAATIADWQFHPVRVPVGVRVAVGLSRDDGMPPVATDQMVLLENLLDQTALALARARAEREARDLVALRERDGMRDALLSTIGQDVKPSLNAISEGVRSLRRAGTADKAAVSAVAAETIKLDRYIDNLLDLAPGADREPIVIGDVAIDLYRRTVTKGAESVHLTPKEYAVLAELAKHAGRVLTHRQLLRAIWGPARQDQIDYLRVAIRALRQKLEDDPADPLLILNEPAVGYRLAGSR